MSYAFAPNRDAGCVSRHRNPDVHRRDHFGKSTLWWKAGARKVNKALRAANKVREIHEDLVEL